MKIDIVAVGKNMPDWVNTGINDYLQRFASQLRCEIIEIAPAKRSKNATATQYKQQEAISILDKIPTQNEVIALDVKGTSWSTPQLAKQIEKWQLNARDITLIIGGPDGLDDRCLARATTHWSLSPLTFPHPLARLILVEQLYRGWSLLNNHPYHRE